MKHELRQMERQGNGAIVNNASVGALTGNPGIASYILERLLDGATRSDASVILTLTLAFASSYQAAKQGSERERSMVNRITVKFGNKAFAATLADNATATAFKTLLPLSLTMTELNGNEKFARLSVSVPTQASTPPAIRTGDLMMYGSSTLVLFYKSFRTTYSYTNIGRVDDPRRRDLPSGSQEPCASIRCSTRHRPLALLARA